MGVAGAVPPTHAGRFRAAAGATRLLQMPGLLRLWRLCLAACWRWLLVLVLAIPGARAVHTGTPSSRPHLRPCLDCLPACCLQEVLNSWFLLGRLGGFNSANLQVQPPACRCCMHVVAACMLHALGFHALLLDVLKLDPWGEVCCGVLPCPAVLPCSNVQHVMLHCCAAALQVLYHQDGDLSELAYDTEGGGAGDGSGGGAMPATFHDMTPLEARGSWTRFW